MGGSGWAPTPDEFAAAAEAFLTAHAPRREPTARTWGEGSDTVAVLAEKTEAEQAREVLRAKEWKACEFDAGFGWITGPPGYGGAGLTDAHRRAYQAVKAGFATPGEGPFRIGLGMVSPTVLAWARDDVRERYLRPLHRGEIIACQLFSEPGAGSDLASLQTRAVRDGDGWVVDGQKVWTSGAHYSDIGLLLCRTDPAAPKHQGLTAFLVDMRAPGVEVRPLRQMTGGASFNEVFLTGVAIPDSHRLGEPGDGWRVAVGTLATERVAMGNQVGEAGAPDLVGRLVGLARHLGRDGEPLVRQAVADAYVRTAVARFNQARVAAAVAAGGRPGPEGSIGKLVLTENQRRIGEVATTLLGERLAADTGEWGTFAWSQFVLGAPGGAIAGGTNQIMRNVLAERALGLPKGPR